MSALCSEPSNGFFTVLVTRAYVSDTILSHYIAHLVFCLLQNSSTCSHQAPPSLKNVYFVCMYVLLACMYICIVCVLCVHRAQKGALDILGLELPIVVCCHVDAES